MTRIALALAGLLAPAALLAQLPDPSPRALGMGDAYTSLARGYEATAWNPAMLAAVGRPGLSIGLPHLDLELGSNTYGFGDFQKYANSFLTDSAKNTLLDKIKPSDSTLTVRTLVGLQPFAISVGPFALAVGSAGQMEASIGKDLVALALFGNARRAATDSSFLDHASNGEGWAATTAALSYAIPIPMPIGHLSVGVTGKYVIGHFLGSFTDLGLRLQSTPTFNGTAQPQAVYTDYPKGCGSIGLGGSGNCSSTAGTGFSLDLGGALQLAGQSVTVSAVLVNALGSMSWNADRFVYERQLRQIKQDSTGNVSDTVLSRALLTTSAQIDADPQAKALRDSLLAHANFARLARVGVAMKSGALSWAADLQVRLEEGLDQQPSQLLAAGAEYKVLGFLPLRAGASWDFGEAWTLAGGFGLQLFGVNLDLSAANISGTVHPGVRLAAGVGLIF